MTNPIRIAHISDLHFPRVQKPVVNGLLTALNESAYDLIVVSGDLTMRARSSEYLEARNFLDGLKAPTICIPGNHDISSTNMLQRFLFAFRHYKKYIGSVYQSAYADERIAAFGLNSVRRIHTDSLDWSRGRVNHRQIWGLERFFRNHKESASRIATLHHPVLLDEVDQRRGLVGRHKPLMEALARSGVEVVLTGHLHRGSWEPLTIGNHSLYVSQCATSSSTRLKGENNSFNELIRDESGWSIQRRVWNETNNQFAA